MGRFKSPLRYPGGKGKLLNFFKLIIMENNLKGCHYFEPFAGGSGLALSLLLDGFVNRIYLNDIDITLFAFWCSVLKNTDELCQMIMDTPVTIEEWNRQKKIMEASESSADYVKLGFSTFFLNRTNRSGILNGGVIGGKKQKGDWKINARYNKKNLIYRIKAIAEEGDRISIYNQDAIKFLQEVLPTVDGNTLVYLDPPYYKKGKKLYKNYYQHEDHEKLSCIVTHQIQHYWIVSYDKVKEINKLYNGFNKLHYKINYSAQNKYKGEEVMFFCDEILIPDVENIVNLKTVNLNQQFL